MSNRSATIMAAPSLTAVERDVLFALIGGADSVELKLTIPESDQRSVVTSLGMDPLEAEIRQVFFFDTPDLQLNAAGVVVRARRVQGRIDDTVVKLRPVVPNELPAGLRSSPNLVVEVDAMPGGFVCSASLKAARGPNHVRETVAGNRTTTKLFSKEQRAFYAQYAPRGIDLDDLSVLGPILVLKLKFSPADFNRKMVAELWSYPDGSRILELSTKSTPKRAVKTVLETRELLAKYGVSLDGAQQTKTKTALEFFAKAVS
jgi:hypothetical protein